MTGDPPRETGAQVIRSEERLRVDTTWQPYERVRLARRVVTELRQVDIEVRREELIFERDAIPDPGDASGVRGVRGRTGWAETLPSCCPKRCR